LRAIGLAKIEMDAFGGRLVARGGHVEPLERIGLFPGARFVKILGGVGELRGELRDEVGSDFVAAGANRGTDRCKEMRGLAAVFITHAADRFFGDASESSLPTRMNRGDGAFFRVDEKNRNAVSGLDGEEQAGCVGGRSVTFARAGWHGSEGIEQGRVDLLEWREGQIVRTKSSLKLLAVGVYVFRRIPFHETKIEQSFTVERAEATDTRAEAVNEPGQFGERSKLEDLQATRSAKGPRRRDFAGFRCARERVTRAAFWLRR